MSFKRQKPSTEHVTSRDLNVRQLNQFWGGGIKQQSPSHDLSKSDRCTFNSRRSEIVASGAARALRKDLDRQLALAHALRGSVWSMRVHDH
ncbi:hypothetical protein J6590_007384 [Homalodisca vitripennis]|nr:hypothetical protein J6590_007384 [Homalodisca vitripennis]